MKRILVLGCLLISFVGLFGQNETSKETKDCTIQGVLDGVYKGTKVYLVEEEEINGASKVIDSCDVKDNRYTFVVKNVTVPRMYFVKSGDPNCLSPITPVWVEPGDVKVRAKSEFFVNCTVTGTANNEIFSAYNAEMKHFVDSISLCKAYDVTQNKTVIDVGTGAGFPGLALKIAFPNLQVTLLDSLNKRINFLNEVISVLGLTGVETIHGRAEDYAKPGKCREKYDLCVSRAVANLSTLSEYCLPFVKVGGKFISYKSEKITEEMNAAQHAVKILGGKMDGQVEFTLPDSDIYRNLFIITKEKSTPAKYPRKAGLPSKEPLS